MSSLITRRLESDFQLRQTRCAQRRYYWAARVTGESKRLNEDLIKLWRMEVSADEADPEILRPRQSTNFDKDPRTRVRTPQQYAIGSAVSLCPQCRPMSLKYTHSTNMYFTSSSAVAEKPRCRLCQFWVGDG